jgi:flagellar biosynthetic protein FliS
MANNSPASTYQQLAARGASPVGLVVSLYDTILRDFRRAQAALIAGDVEQRVFELNHALTVIAHLQSVLNQRLRQMLLAQRSQLASNQARLQAVSNWATALSTTQQL